MSPRAPSARSDFEMNENNLTAVERKGKSTNKELSTLRANAQIPCIIYGGSKANVRISLASKELLALRKKAGVNAVLTLKVGSANETVIIKTIQWHPVTDLPVHADFQRISMTEKIEARVPIEITGEAPGVKLGGGVLEHEFRLLTIKAVATKIPKRITVDVSTLELGKHILVSELDLPSDIEVITNPEQIVVHVTIPRVEEEVAPVEAVDGEAAPGDSEPESSSVKGKKDEEGKLVKKEEAPPGGDKAAKPAAKKEK